MIGIASTGSGKTCAFVLPMLTHIMDQPELQKGDGPIGVVIAPTHELAEQIVKETRRFAKGLGVRCTAVFGGVGKYELRPGHLSPSTVGRHAVPRARRRYEQFKELKAGSEVVVGTPGRLLELIKAKGGLSMTRVTYVVIDEADRMFSLGFEPQVRSVVGQVRPDRQTLLFSATFKPNLERLARDVLTEPVRVTIGEAGDANEDVTQVVEVLHTEALKWGWLTQRLGHFLQLGTVLVFVSTKQAADELARNLSAHTPHRVEAIHGDRTQAERQEILLKFKRGSTPILVATDVASRGLDIPAIKTVLNFDAAKRIDDHTHRIGRTGRAGATDGIAYTLVTLAESDAAVDLVRSLLTAKQHAPPDLVELAKKSRRWASSGLSARVEAGSQGGAGAGGDARSSGAGSTGQRAPSHGESPVNVFKPPQLFQAEKQRQAAVSATNPSAPLDALSMAKAVAAKLSNQSDPGNMSHAFDYSSLVAARPPPPSSLGFAPPAPVAPAAPTALAGPSAPVLAARAAAQALAAKLSANLAAQRSLPPGMAQPPTLPGTPPPPPLPPPAPARGFPRWS